MRGALRAALRPGVSANVTLGQVADEAQQPRAPIGSPGSSLNKLDMLADIFKAKELASELRLSLQRVLLKFIRAPLWYPTQPLSAPPDLTVQLPPNLICTFRGLRARYANFQWRRASGISPDPASLPAESSGAHLVRSLRTNCGPALLHVLRPYT